MNLEEEINNLKTRIKFLEDAMKNSSHGNLIRHHRYCKKCDILFKKDHRNQIYCSMDCRLKDRYTIDNYGCWIWTGGKDADGYGHTTFRNYTRKAHRMAYIAWKGEIPDGLQVCHTCDKPSCINPDHLFLGTIGENMRDKFSKGRQKVRGEESAVAIIKEQDVRDIFDMKEKGMTPSQISKNKGLGLVHVCQILKRRIWKHVEINGVSG